MIWLLVLGGLALAGFVALIIYGFSLKYKIEAVASEFAMVRTRSDEMRKLIGQLKLPVGKRE